MQNIVLLKPSWMNEMIFESNQLIRPIWHFQNREASVILLQHTKPTRQQSQNVSSAQWRASSTIQPRQQEQKADKHATPMAAAFPVKQRSAALWSRHLVGHVSCQNAKGLSE
jgi:hypothetical protein